MHIFSCPYGREFISPSVFLFPHVGEGSSGDHECSLEVNSLDQVCVEMNGRRKMRKTRRERGGGGREGRRGGGGGREVRRRRLKKKELRDKISISIKEKRIIFKSLGFLRMKF